MTDTCNPVRKFCRLLKGAIEKITKESGTNDKEIEIYEAGKWVDHDESFKIEILYSLCLLHQIVDIISGNVWFCAVITKLGDNLKDMLDSDLEEIHFTLRITTDVNNLLRAIEKYFGATANYGKGKGSMFMEYMRH